MKNDILSELEDVPVGGIMRIESANSAMAVAASLPELKAVFDPFIYEGECSILFADTNVGKSILAVQIAEEAAFAGHRVIYFDLELSKKQFAQRYTNSRGEMYRFSDNLFRAEIDYGNYRGEQLEVEVLNSIELSVRNFKADFIVIDNITFLCLQSEMGVEAGALMLRLTELKRRYNLTMLVVAHTPKRPAYEPLTQNSLAGSKRIANFADSIFAMGKSRKGENVRYIKQIKSRSGGIVYGGDSVMECTLAKTDAGLMLSEVGTSTEREHLADNDDNSEIDDCVMQLLGENKSYRQIARELGVSLARVQRSVARGKKDDND